jgi:hypothetical protein
LLTRLFNSSQCIGFDPYPDVMLHLHIPVAEFNYKVRFCNVMALTEPVASDEEFRRFVPSLDAASVLRAANCRISNTMAGSRARDCLMLYSTCSVPGADVRSRSARLLKYLKALENAPPFSDPPRFLCWEIRDGEFNDPVTRHLLQMRPACMGNGEFHLHGLFRGGVGVEQAAIRMVRYAVNGFCICCQMKYEEQPGSRPSAFCCV